MAGDKRKPNFTGTEEPSELECGNQETMSLFLHRQLCYCNGFLMCDTWPEPVVTTHPLASQLPSRQGQGLPGLPAGRPLATRSESV